MITATHLDNHFIEVPTRTGVRTTATKIARNQLAELPEPASNRFVGNTDATIGQQILYITKPKREPVVEPDRMSDDLAQNDAVCRILESYRDRTGPSSRRLTT